MDIGRKLAELEARLARVEASPRLSHAAIDNTSVEVRDSNGSLRGLLGVQADGTTAVNIVNGPPPPQPTDPVVMSVLGGVAASWDGTFTDGAMMPLDWQRVEVHASATSGFTPDAGTLRGTIETPQGATVVVTTDTPVYVRLLARSTSGTPSTPSGQAGPYGPAPVVADDILDGIVTAAKIAEGAVTINALTESLADTASQRYVDAMADPTAWTVLSTTAGTTWDFLTGVTDAPTGSTVAQATGFTVVRGNVQLPYDPDVLYRISARVRTTAASTSGADTLYVGALGIGANGTTYVNRTGANSYFTQHQPAAAGASQPTGAGWVTYTGYLRGRAATGTATTSPDPRTPGVVHNDVRFIAPLLYLNFGSGSSGANSTTGTMQVDAFTIEALKTGIVDSTNLVAGSVTTAALAADSVTATAIAANAVTAAKINAGAVTTGKLDTLAVTSDKIAANAITTGKIQAGAVTTDKLTVTGGSNLLTDPSFEGAYTASLVAGSAFASQDTTKGNGSPTSLRINAVSATAVFRSVALTSIATLPGEQWHLGVDYWVSADWVGTEISIHARWETATGAVVSYSKVLTTAPAREGWTRLEGTVTAPATTARLVPRVESGSATAGTVWFDNAVVRPVLGGTQIQDGAITTDKIAANAITGKTITGGLIQTATSGQRITLNEGNVNKIIVYNSAGTAIGELSAAGLLVKGTGGAVLSLDPNQTYPHLRMTNAALTNAAVINVVETTAGAADLGLNTGTFTASSFTDMTWRTFMGNDFAVIERYSKGNPTTKIGGRLDLRANRATIGYYDDTGATQAADLMFAPGLAHIRARAFIEPSAGDSSTLLFLQPGPSHTGYILRYYDPDALTYRFSIDKAGNTDVNGILTAGNIAAGRITITPTAANTPTSGNVTGLNLKGTNIRVVATPSTTVPGTSVLGVGVTNVSSNGFTVWLTRNNTASTGIDWIAFGV